ncbi:MAG TPA: 8-amino-7-oxononanoate synthase [Rhodospirillaceae bacterium]|nr:8-amino-7-oxononanoate synthase [Rhodospirillaceae bacterium]
MDQFRNRLDILREKGRYRALKQGEGVDLTSNDYLGFRNHPALRAEAVEAVESGVGLGSGGSRLLRGNHEAHESLENFAAQFFGYERALYFATGFQANYALFTTLPTRHDAVLFDSLVHASVRDGIHAGQAKGVKIPHNDVNACEDAIKRLRGEVQQIYIAVESLYSMDGDFAPLAAFQELARQYGATLIVDEAHATGVSGEAGRGCASALPRDNLIVLHACGKALGGAGGLVCASAEIIDILVNTARPFIFSTAPPPLQAHLAQKALELCASEEGAVRRNSLSERCEQAQQFFGGAGSHIVPIIFGDDQRTVEIAEALQKKGFDIRAIRPPTVPEGTARLRLSLSANLDKGMLDRFFGHLAPHFQDRAA